MLLVETKRMARLGVFNLMTLRFIPLIVLPRVSALLSRNAIRRVVLGSFRYQRTISDTQEKHQKETIVFDPRNRKSRRQGSRIKYPGVYKEGVSKKIIPSKTTPLSGVVQKPHLQEDPVRWAPRDFLRT